MSEDWKSKPDSFWRERLNEMQFKVARKGGTERAFSGEYWDHKEVGTYNCVCCGNPLFHSETKYDSGTGWPSYFAPIDSAAIEEREDNKLWQRRTEVCCSVCAAHLGHVFPDGPEPGGQRYCMNSAALCFVKDDKE